MLFMVMHKMTPELEAGAPPRQGLIEEMGKLIGETIEQGKFHNAAGLKRTAERVRWKRKGGQVEVTRAPRKGDSELLAGFAMLTVKSMDEALAWAQRIADAEGTGDVELDVGPVVEPWDLGIMPRPAGDVPLKVMVLRKADAASEAGQKPPADAVKRMEALFSEMKASGVLLAVEGLKPSARGARLQAKQGKHVWTDGPFAESKEMISGFTILKGVTLAEAKEWTDLYADILGDIEVDVREVEA
jgi:hypothetical protein